MMCATARGVEEIARARGCLVERGKPLGGCTTLGVGGPAEWLVTPQAATAIPGLLQDLREAGMRVWILGNGSNLLVADRGVPGVVVRIGRLPLTLRVEGTEMTASASWALPALAREAAERSLSGLEWAEGIPGTLGGALVMNAGAFGHDTAEVAVRALLVAASGELLDRSLRREEFGYRSSPLRAEEPVLEATLRLRGDSREAVLERMRGFRQKRSVSAPVREKSAGCIFRNPPGDSAGRLVDACGFKGTRVGGARVSEIHGNYFVNDGSATAADFDALIRTVREGVAAKTGILLEEEVKRWGA